MPSTRWTKSFQIFSCILKINNDNNNNQCWGKYQLIFFFSPPSNILSMHILSEKLRFWRFCSLRELVTCMQRWRGGRFSLVSPLCNASAYKIHTHLFHVTYWITLLALTTVPREIWQITKNIFNGGYLSCFQINKYKTSQSMCKYQTCNTCEYFCIFLCYTNLYWFAAITMINPQINSF